MHATIQITIPVKLPPETTPPPGSPDQQPPASGPSPTPHPEGAAQANYFAGILRKLATHVASKGKLVTENVTDDKGNNVGTLTVS
jgi:hypothetical protein